jgi:transcriptional regulator with XRE-family HTH domain
MSSRKRNEVIMVPVQSKMARAALGWRMEDVAKAAKVAAGTVVRFEAGEELKPRTVEAIQLAYESAGVEFTNSDAPGVKVRDKVLLGKRGALLPRKGR